MRFGGIRLATLRGTRIMVHPSWLFIFALAVLWFGTAGGPISSQIPAIERWVLAPVVGALFFLCVLAHELGHVVVTRLRGVEVPEITLFVFGSAARMEQDVPTAATEVLATLAGPLVSGILGAALIGLSVTLGSGPTLANDPVTASLVAAEICGGLAIANILLLVFHLVPGFPMDGGRLLRGVLWGVGGDFLKATGRATRLGRLLSLALIGGGFTAVAANETLIGLWAVVVGWFLYRGAQVSFRKVEMAMMVDGVFVRDVMDRDFNVVSPTLTLDTFMDQSTLDDGPDLYPVTADGGLVGTIDVGQVNRVPRAEWPTTRINDVMSRGDAIWTLTEPQPAMDAVDRFQGTGTTAIPVVDETDKRKLLGLVTRDGLVRALRRREALRGG